MVVTPSVYGGACVRLDALSFLKKQEVERVAALHVLKAGSDSE